MTSKSIAFTFFLMVCICPSEMSAGIVRGTVTDKTSGEPLIGATDTIVSDYDLDIDDTTLGEVTVTARVRHDSETAQVREQQTSLVVQTGVSAQTIIRTQDKDASEVVRRIPGVSIIDGKFIMVRGLSQRYNNVWLNGGTVPSSEADSRAFSFDILPASQLDNVVVVKSPAPEYPADFSGGFILVNTRQMPSQGKLEIGAGIGLNTQTMFHDFTTFRSGHALKSGINGSLTHSGRNHPP